MKNTSIQSKGSMIVNKLPAYFLFVCIGVILFYLLKVIDPFIIVLIFASIVATVTYPLYLKFLKIFGNRARLASVSTCFVVIFALVIPLVFFAVLLTKQAVDIYKSADVYVQNTHWDTILKWQPGNFVYDFLGDYRESVRGFIENNEVNLKNSFSDTAKYLSTQLATRGARILTSLVSITFNLLLLFFTLYFLYKDGQRVLKKLMLLSPIPVVYEKEIFKKFTEISRATIFGTFLTALAQGIVAWIGFSIAGLPSAFFWATAVLIFSLVPIVGTALVWLPAGMIMLFSGNIFSGIFILLWGACLISTVDNFLRAIFIGSSANLNPLLTFLAVFGGITAFGLVGVIFGPMLLVLFFTFLHIYELEYAEILEDSSLKILDERKNIAKNPFKKAVSSLKKR